MIYMLRKAITAENARGRREATKKDFSACSAISAVKKTLFMIYGEPKEHDGLR
jgi:hypothetical protein